MMRTLMSQRIASPAANFQSYEEHELKRASPKLIIHNVPLPVLIAVPADTHLAWCRASDSALLRRHGWHLATDPVSACVQHRVVLPFAQSGEPSMEPGVPRWSSHTDDSATCSPRPQPEHWWARWPLLGHSYMYVHLWTRSITHLTAAICSSKNIIINIILQYYQSSYIVLIWKNIYFEHFILVLNIVLVSILLRTWFKLRELIIITSNIKNIKTYLNINIIQQLHKVVLKYTTQLTTYCN